MKLFNNEKGDMYNMQHVLKGLVIGLIIGAAIVYLMHKGIIPINLP